MWSLLCKLHRKVVMNLNNVYFAIKPFLMFCKVKFLYTQKPLDTLRIPIIINNRNRLSFLKTLIHSLESRGYTNIYIIDNASSYPPLLNWYEKECAYKVYRLNQNLGHLALWKSGIIKQFRKDYFVYTDPDVVPDENCPADFMEVFLSILKKYPFIEKVGFALKIDDLPDSFDKKKEVTDWEQQFWRRRIENNLPLYKAAIDTTFALYRPYYLLGGNLHSPHIRVGEPYVAKHLPWYSDSAHLLEEDIYYIQHSETFTHWTTGKMK